MQTQSADFIAALADNNLRPFVVAEIIEGGASIYDDPLYTLQGISGSMDLDETRPARRKFGSLKLIDKKGDLTPRSVGDLLHPNSGNEIRIRKGLNYKNLNLLSKANAYLGDGLLHGWGLPGNFGRNTAGQQTAGMASIGTMSKAPGAYSLILSAPTWDQCVQDIVVMPGHAYVMVVWVMGLSAGATFEYGLDLFDASDAYIGYMGSGTKPAPQGVWTPYVQRLNTDGGNEAFSGPLGNAHVGQMYLQQDSGAGTVIAFNAMSVYFGGELDANRPLKPQSEYNWLGFFRFDNQTVDDSGETLSLTLGGLDRAFAFQQARWTRPFQIPRNTTIPEAIRRILADRWTGKHPIQLDATACAGHPILAMTVPNAVFGADQTASDPWADCQTLAAVGGCELFPGPTGIVILRPFIDPSLVPISASYVESWKAGGEVEPGTFALIPPIGREIDPTKLFSGIIVTGGNSQDKPCRAEVWDTDPASPTYVGKVGYIPAYYDSPLLRDTLQCFIAGRGLLARIRLSSEVVTANIISNPGHEGGDGVFLDRARAKATGIYVLSNLTMDLAPTGGMSITSRSTTDLGPLQASLS